MYSRAVTKEATERHSYSLVESYKALSWPVQPVRFNRLRLGVEV